MEVRYVDEKQVKPIRRTFIGTEDCFVGYKKLLQEKAAQQKQAKMAEMMKRQKTSKIAMLRKASQTQGANVKTETM